MTAEPPGGRAPDAEDICKPKYMLDGEVFDDVTTLSPAQIHRIFEVAGQQFKRAEKAEQERDVAREAPAASREVIEKLADVAQFVLDRITNGATSDERYAMKDAARIAMDAYRALAATRPDEPTGDYVASEEDDERVLRCRECGCTSWPESNDPELRTVTHEATCTVGASEGQ